MVPSKTPIELSNLNEIETMLISKIIPTIKIYKKGLNEDRVSGHCINVSNNVQNITNILPRKIDECEIFFSSEYYNSKEKKYFNISSSKILKALL